MLIRKVPAWTLAAAVVLASACAHAQTDPPAGDSGEGLVSSPPEGPKGAGSSEPSRQTPADKAGSGEKPDGADTEKKAPPEKDAPPQRPGGLRGLLSGGGGLIFIMLGGLVLMMFWSSRSRRKQQAKKQEMLDSLKKGQKVISIGGIVGTVIEVRAKDVTLKVDETSNVRMRFVRSAIQGSWTEPATELLESRP